MMEEKFLQNISKANKKAEIKKTDSGFLVNLYLDNKLYQKRTTLNVDEAETIAEDFVIGSLDGPQFLND